MALASKGLAIVEPHPPIFKPGKLTSLASNQTKCRRGDARKLTHRITTWNPISPYKPKGCCQFGDTTMLV
eukprot:scaffold2003_cov139-Cylindrotheca_fusiformis.AAC.18